MKKEKLLSMIISVGISLGIWMGLGVLICWIFGWTFSAKIVFGSWLIVFLVKSVL